jgi:hypothetical protein
VAAGETASLSGTWSVSGKTWAAARPAGQDESQHMLMLWRVQDHRAKVEWCGLVSLWPLLQWEVESDSQG